MVNTRRQPRAPEELQLEPDTARKNGSSKKMQSNGYTEPMEIVLSDSPKKKEIAEKKKNNLTMKQLAEKEGDKPNMREVKDDQTGKSSMAVLLTQGLMANDAEKVDSVLKETDLELIKATLNELNVVHIIPLLKALEHRLRTRERTDIRGWLRWIQSTMSFHMSFLSSQSSLDKELGRLMEWMKSRSLHHQKLFELHGKLTVLVDQIERRSNTTIHVAPQPLIVFNNDEVYDSDADELESFGEDESVASSEEDWWDEGEIRQGIEDDDDDDEDEELEDLDDGRGTTHQDIESDDDEDEDEEMEED